MVLKSGLYKSFIKLYIIMALLIGVFYNIQAVSATELPESIVEYVNKTFPGANIRFDGLITLPDGNIYIPVMPVSYPETEGTVRVTMLMPEKSELPDMIIFSNNLALMRIIQDKNGNKTFLKGSNVPLKVKLGLLPQDLIVPEGLIIPEDLNSIVGDLVISEKRPEPPVLKPIVSDNTQNNVAPLANGNSNVVLQPLKPSDDVNPSDRLPGISSDKTFDFGSKLLYIINVSGNKVYIFDPRLSQVVSSVQVASLPYAAVLSLDKKHLYVICMTANSLASINTQTNQLENMIKVGLKPTSIAISPDGSKLFVSNNSSSSVSVVDTALFEITANVDVDGMPDGVISSRDNQSFYIFDKASGIVGKWDYLNISRKQFFFVVKNPYAIAIDSEETKLYVTSRTQNNLMIYNILQKKYDNLLAVGNKPVDVDISEDGGRAYVLNAGDDSISVVDTVTCKVIDTIVLASGGFPGGLTLIPGENKALVTNAELNKVVLVDLVDGNVISMIDIGMRSKSIIIGPSENENVIQSPVSAK